MNKKFRLKCSTKPKPGSSFYLIKKPTTNDKNILRCWNQKYNEKFKVNKLLIDYCIYYDNKCNRKYYQYQVEKI